MRNALTLLVAACRRRVLPTDAVDCSFRVMPWEVGLRTFKSDRYFAAAEAAQLDYLARTGILRPMLAGRIGWVNLGQASALRRPLRLLQRYVVTTRVACTDGKHAYFVHTFSSAQGQHAQVLVKAKFKQGALTVAPEALLGTQPADKPAAVRALDSLTAPGGSSPG